MVQLAGDTRRAVFSKMLPHNLDPVDVRVIGCLIEKELSTPDHYPLSLNALTSA